MSEKGKDKKGRYYYSYPQALREQDQEDRRRKGRI